MFLNLTEQRLKSDEASLIEKLSLKLRLDFYYADSFSTMERSFSINPPRKKDIASSWPSAYVLLDDVSVRRMSRDIFDGDFDPYFPDLRSFGFEMSDYLNYRTAIWGSGNSSYKKAKREFGFDEISFVSIPRVCLKYYHDPPRSLHIVSFNRAKISTKQTLKGFKALRTILNPQVGFN